MEDSFLGNLVAKEKRPKDDDVGGFLYRLSSEGVLQGNSKLTGSTYEHRISN